MRKMFFGETMADSDTRVRVLDGNEIREIRLVADLLPPNGPFGWGAKTIGGCFLAAAIVQEILGVDHTDLALKLSESFRDLALVPIQGSSWVRSETEFRAVLSELLLEDELRARIERLRMTT